MPCEVGFCNTRKTALAPSVPATFPRVQLTTVSQEAAPAMACRFVSQSLLTLSVSRMSRCSSLGKKYHTALSGHWVLGSRLCRLLLPLLALVAHAREKVRAPCHARESKGLRSKRERDVETDYDVTEFA